MFGIFAKGMLEAYLNLDLDAATRKHAKQMKYRMKRN